MASFHHVQQIEGVKIRNPDSGKISFFSANCEGFIQP